MVHALMAAGPDLVPLYAIDASRKTNEALEHLAISCLAEQAKLLVDRYASAVCVDDDVTLDDFREAVATLEDVERIARRVFGGAHPTTTGIEGALRRARAVLRSPSACALLRRNKKQ